MRHFAAFNIGSLAIASITADGCFGHLSGGLVQGREVPTLGVREPWPLLGCGFIADWDPIVDDTREPEHGAQVASFVVAQQTRHTRTVLEKLLEPNEPQSHWALACATKFELPLMKSCKTWKVTAEWFKKLGLEPGCNGEVGRTREAGNEGGEDGDGEASRRCRTGDLLNAEGSLQRPSHQQLEN